MASSLEGMINYGVYTATDADEMARLLGEVIAHRDPPAIAVGLTPAEFESFVRLFCPKAATEGLTIVARSAETGEMIGALLTEDSSGAPPEGMERLSAKFGTYRLTRSVLGVQLAQDARGSRTSSGRGGA